LWHCYCYFTLAFMPYMYDFTGYYYALIPTFSHKIRSSGRMVPLRSWKTCQARNLHLLCLKAASLRPMKARESLAMTANHSTFASANAAYAANFGSKGELPLPPAKKVRLAHLKPLQHFHSSIPI
jgi:hypothetical protein